MARIIYFNLNEDVARRQIIGLKGVQAQAGEFALERAEIIFETKKQQFIEDFNNHPVSQEIKLEENGGNLAGTLDSGDDNLWGFIGFQEGENPIQEVSEAIEANTHLDEHGVPKIRQGTQLEFTFKVTAPSLQDLEPLTPFNWGGGSWLAGIEKGISGLSYYIAKLGFGRSGGGIQAKNRYRKSAPGFKTTNYYSSLVNEFLASLSKIIK